MQHPRLHRRRAVVRAGPLLLACLAAGQAAHAAPTAPKCPLVMDVVYTRVGTLDFGTPASDPERRRLDTRGFTARFAPAKVRLISASLAAAAAGPVDGISHLPPDNAMDARPGDALVYTLWPAGQPQPAADTFVTCAYEGGMALQLRLDRATRGCTLRVASRPSTNPQDSTREFVTRADFDCR